MIIRRRTYIKQFTGRYGYFMRNTSFMGGRGEQTHLNNIYTKCMQKESPIGQFPLSLRTADYAYSSAERSQCCAVGYTDGRTIIVATAKKLYINTSGGSGNWTLLCTWNNDAYISRLAGPIVWMDSSYYYIVYVSLDSPGSASGYQRLKVFRYNRSNGSTGTTNVLSAYYYNSGNGAQAPLSFHMGAYYAAKVSPKGQTMIYYSDSDSSNYYQWVILDIPRLVTSAIITQYYTTQSYGGQGNWQMAGQWFNDGTTYGKFYYYLYDGQGQGETFVYTYKYYTATASQFSNGGVITSTEITSTLGRLVTDNYGYFNGRLYYYPAFLIASCDDSYKNKLFIIAIQGDTNNFRAYICDSNFSNQQALPQPTGWQAEVHGVEQENYYPSWDGTFVTPDGMYGCAFFDVGTMTWNLNDKSYYGAYSFGITGGDGEVINMESNSFMLPHITL